MRHAAALLKSGIQLDPVFDALRNLCRPQAPEWSQVQQQDKQGKSTNRGPKIDPNIYYDPHYQDFYIGPLIFLKTRSNKRQVSSSITTACS